MENDNFEEYSSKQSIKQVNQSIKQVTVKQMNPPTKEVDLPERDENPTIEFIYFVASKSYDELVKIGRTCNMKKRMSVLNTSCPDKLFLYGLIRTSKKYDLESIIHDDLCKNRYRLDGEWFKLSKCELDEVITKYKKYNIGELNEKILNVLSKTPKKHKNVDNVKFINKISNDSKIHPDVETLINKIDKLQQDVREIKQNRDFQMNDNNIHIESFSVTNINCFGQQTYDHVELNDMYVTLRFNPLPEIAPNLIKSIHRKFENRNIHMNHNDGTEVLVLREKNGIKMRYTENIEDIYTTLLQNVIIFIEHNNSILTRILFQWDPLKAEIIEYIYKCIQSGPDNQDLQLMINVLFSLRITKDQIPSQNTNFFKI